MTQSPLTLKTYFSSTVEAAVDLARRELGSEAMLVKSRRAPEEARHLGTYEVIFATGTPPESRKALAPAPRPTGGDTDRQLADIRDQLASLRQSMWSSHRVAAFSGSSGEANALLSELEANGVEAALSREMIQALGSAHKGGEALRSALASDMENRLLTTPSLHRQGHPRSVTAFVGPPGRGKSTTLVKLAVAEGLTRGTAVRILSMDSYRIGAGEQMRSYATILGVPFHACDSVRELERQLEASWGYDPPLPSLTLIDTSGLGPNEIEEGAPLAAFLAAHPEINVQLVLRADAKTADGLATVRRFSHFQPAGIIFTGMDEADTLGSVFSIAVKAGKPISFLGSGQSIPEDLEPAVSAKIVRRVLESRATPISAVA